MVDSRRRLLFGGAAATAAVAGGALAWWRLQPHASSDAVSPDFWDRSFDTPTGGSVSLSSLRGKHSLVNFWATWCAPCVEEMPRLDAFYRQNAAAGWQVLGLAIDQPSSVRQFLVRTPVSFPIGLAGLGGTELVKSLGNTVGGLPFSVLFGPDGRVRERKMGQLSTAELGAWRSAAGI